MAHTLTKSNALVTLTVSSSATLFVDDYITGVTSGAVGILCKKINATHIAVYEMSATAFAPTETITAVGGASTSCTGTGAYSTGDLSSDACLVEGSNSSVTDIFRQIANVASISGVSNPSSTQKYLGLDIQVYIGRKGQSADTVALTQEECVVFGATANVGCLRVIGDSSHSSTLINGKAKYKDDDLDNFPPLYTERGSCIKFDCDSQLVKEGFTVNQYGHFYNYRATLEGSNIYNGTNWNASGQVRLSDISYLKWGAFSGVVPPCKLYLNSIYIQEQQYAWCLLGVVPEYSANIYFQNSAGADFLYSWASNFEIAIRGVRTYDDNGDLISGFDNFVELGLSYIVVHAINSDIDSRQISSFYGGSFDVLEETSFKLTVIDKDDNPIENVTVELTDSNGNALYKKISAVTNAVISTSTTTVVLSPNNSEISVGDMIRIGSEKMLVTAKPNSTNCTVTRARENTTAELHGNATYGYTFNVYVSENGLTDSNGQIDYNGLTTKSAIATRMASYNAGLSYVDSGDFTLKLYKDGYETYYAPVRISGINGVDIQIKLRHSASAGRDAMAEAFR